MPEADPAVFAHRGFAGVAPENTVPAVERAAREGADWVEVDAVPTADGDVVAFHDRRLDAGPDSRGITDAAGVVWETPTPTVRGATVLDSAATVPLLAELVAALPDDVGVNVELKNPGRDDVRPDAALSGDDLAAAADRWEPFVAAVASALADAGNPVLLSSFAAGALAVAREVASGYPRAAIATDAETGLALARRHDCRAVHPPVDAFLEGGGVPAVRSDAPDVLDRAREAGLDANVWTVRTWHEAETLRRLGVDGLIADYPGLLFDH